MTDKITKKACLNELLFGGFVVGILYSLTIFGVYYLKPSTPLEAWMFRIYGIAVLAGCQLRFGRRVAAVRDVNGAGYSYLQALGFSVKMMLLSGILFGFSNWLLNFVIDPSAGVALREAVMEQALKFTPDASDEMIETYRTTLNMTTSVWGMIAQGVLAMLFNGGFVALITSAFIKRKTDIFKSND